MAYHSLWHLLLTVILLNYFREEKKLSIWPWSIAMALLAKRGSRLKSCRGKYEPFINVGKQGMMFSIHSVPFQLVSMTAFCFWFARQSQHTSRHSSEVSKWGHCIGWGARWTQAVIHLCVQVCTILDKYTYMWLLDKHILPRLLYVYDFIVSPNSCIWNSHWLRHDFSSR